MPHATLYTLSDPRTPGNIRYVGWTSRTPGVRLSCHIYDAKHGGYEHRRSWIRLLLSDGLRPLMKVVAVCGVEEGPQAEIDLIAALRGLGYDLVNTSTGGEGCPGHVMSAEARAKIGAAHRGMKMSPEECARRSERMKGNTYGLGRVKSPETRAKLSAALRGKKRTPEHCAAISRALTGKKQSEEHRLANSRGHLGQAPRVQSPEERARTSARLKLYWNEWREEHDHA